MADLSFLVDYSQVKAANQEINKIGSSAQKSASVFEAAFKKAEAQQKRSLDAVRQQIAFSQRMEAQKAKEARAVAAAAKAEADAVKNNAAAIAQFRSSYDQAYSIQQKTLHLKGLLRQAIANETMTVREAGAELLRYKQALIAAGHAQTAFGKTMNRTGVITQQAGYQVGDFLVQVQSGTNPMVAFGQQATQLVGSLYYLPPAVLAARTSIMGMSFSLGGMLPIIGIAIPLITALAAAWMRTRKDAEDSSKSVDKLKESLDSLASTYEEWDRARQAAFAGVTVDEFTAAANVRQATEEYEALRVKATEAFNAIERADGTWDNAKAQEHKLLQEQAAAAAERLAEAERVAANIQNKAAVERSASASERAKDFADTLQSYREELQISQAILKYGEDSVQVADLKRQHYLASVTAAAAEATEVESARKAMVDLAMEAYDAEVAINKGADAAARMGEGFSAAAARVREITAEVGNFYGALASGGLDVTALEAQLNALQGGATTAQAAGEALRTQLMSTQLAKDIMSGGSVGEQATFLQGVNQQVANEIRRRELQASIGEFNKTDTGGGGGKTAAETLADNLTKLQETLSVQELLNGKTEAQRQIIQALGSNYTAVDAAILQGLEDKINKQIEYNQEIERQQGLADTMKSSMENGFTSIVAGTTSAKDAFKSMAAEILKELYRVLVVQQMVGSWSQSTGTGSGIVGSIMSAFQADGGVWNKGVQMFADGGVVNGPTAFGHSGGVGVMGEAGPEAIMPLKRGPDGKLGVAGGGNVTVVQNFSFSANGDESVKRIIAQAAPQIAQMTQKQIMDSRRRGGQMKATFS